MDYKEKECEVCGVWFTPTRANAKYCPACRVLPQLSVFSFLYYRKYSIINISKDMREAAKCQVHTVHYV